VASRLLASRFFWNMLTSTTTVAVTVVLDFGINIWALPHFIEISEIPAAQYGKVQQCKGVL
jgi:hypothetical protein